MPSVEMSLEGKQGITTKRCTACRQEKPATADYFHYRIKSQGAFHALCKICKNRYAHLNRRGMIQTEAELCVCVEMPVETQDLDYTHDDVLIKRFRDGNSSTQEFYADLYKKHGVAALKVVNIERRRWGLPRLEAYEAKRLLAGI